MAAKGRKNGQVGQGAEDRAERYADAEEDPASVLSRRQLAAAALVADGKSDAEVSEAIGVDALIVMRWRTRHPAFRAVVNRAGVDRLDQARRKVRALLPLALDRLERALGDPEDGVKVALALVRLAGLERTDVVAVGPVDVEDVMNERRRDLFDDPFALDYETAALIYWVKTEGLDDDDGAGDLPAVAPHTGRSSARADRGG